MQWRLGSVRASMRLAWAISDALKRLWFLGGAKHGIQRCNPFIHIGRPDDYVRRILDALVGPPAGHWSEVVTARQIPCKNGHDAHFCIDGGGAAAGGICALRH